MSLGKSRLRNQFPNTPDHSRSWLIAVECLSWFLCLSWPEMARISGSPASVRLPRWTNQYPMATYSLAWQLDSIEWSQSEATFTCTDFNCPTTGMARSLSPHIHLPLILSSSWSSQHKHFTHSSSSPARWPQKQTFISRLILSWFPIWYFEFEYLHCIF